MGAEAQAQAPQSAQAGALPLAVVFQRAIERILVEARDSLRSARYHRRHARELYAEAEELSRLAREHGFFVKEVAVRAGDEEEFRRQLDQLDGAIATEPQSQSLGGTSGKDSASRDGH